MAESLVLLDEAPSKALPAPPPQSEPVPWAAPAPIGATIKEISESVKGMLTGSGRSEREAGLNA